METVGVGQDEIDIVKLADVSVVVLVPGMGDDVQALKAGIMEIGDIFVINKCDRPGVEKMERAVLAMLSLAHRPDGWQPPIVKTVATEGSGIDELARDHSTMLFVLPEFRPRASKEGGCAKQRLMTLLEERLREDRPAAASFRTARSNKVVDEIADTAAGSVFGRG